MCAALYVYTWRKKEMYTYTRRHVRSGGGQSAVTLQMPPRRYVTGQVALFAIEGFVWF